MSFPKELLDGYAAFRKGDYLSEKVRFETLAEHGQKPKTMVICCCDSRAAPETIFNAHPGDVFVVRNVANLVPSSDMSGESLHGVCSAMEFAVQALKVEHLVVMGHGKCGGISAALNPEMVPLSENNFIGSWIEPLKPIAEPILDDDKLSADERQLALERESVRKSVENLRSYAFILELEKAGRLTPVSYTHLTLPTTSRV